MGKIFNYKAIDRLEHFLIKNTKSYIDILRLLTVFNIILISIAAFLDNILLHYLVLASANVTIVIAAISIFLFRRFLKRTSI